MIFSIQSTAFPIYPKSIYHLRARYLAVRASRTMCPGDLAPDNTDLGTLNLTLGPVDESDFLSAVELGGLGIGHAIELENAIM